MAILNQIRRRGLFLVLVIAMALFSFVLADLFRNTDGFTQKNQEIIATVNGNDIGRDAFMNKVETAQRNSRGRNTSTQAMNQVWDQELRTAIMNSQYEALGLKVGRDYMRDLLKASISGLEEFQDADGVFDENKLNEFIANLKAIAPDQSLLGGSPIDYQSWTNFENNIATSGLQESYFNMVKAGLAGTLAEGELDYRLANDQVDIRFVQIPYTTIADSTITVKTSDVTNYINENKIRYEVDETRDIKFVEFEEVASLDDENNLQSELTRLLEGDPENTSARRLKDVEDVADFVNEHSDVNYVNTFVHKSGLPIAYSDSLFALNPGEVFGPYKDGNFYKISRIVAETQLPDSVNVRHILIPFAGAARSDATTRTDAQAKATADSIYNEINSGRASFMDLLDLSSDLVSNQNDGEIEFSYLAPMAQEFKDFSFENNEGDLEVVRTQFGYHVIEILNQKNKQRAIKVATITKAIEPSEETKDIVFNNASKFEIALSNGDFDAIAEENNYVVRPVSGIGVLDENIPGIGNQRPLVRWAFEEDTKVGDYKRFDVQGGGYAIAVVTAVNEEGLMSVEKASVTALPAIRKQKKAEMIRARISGSSLEEIATAEGQTVKTALALNMKTPTVSGAGREPKIVGAAFGLEEGEISKPVDGNSGVYVVQVTKITPAEPQPNYQAAANRIGTAKIGTVNVDLYNALRKAADIEDNRSTFY